MRAGALRCMIPAMGKEISRTYRGKATREDPLRTEHGPERAIVVSSSPRADDESDARIAEMIELLRTAGADTIRTVMQPPTNSVVEGLWALLEDSQADRSQRLRAACFLASSSPQDPRWGNVRDDVASRRTRFRTSTTSCW